MDESYSENFSKESIPRSKSYKKSHPRYLLSSVHEPKVPSFISKSDTDNKVDWENSNEKQQLSDQLKNQQKEINFLHSILNQFLETSLLPKIKEKSGFDLNTNIWTLPSFIIQQRKPIFPNMNKSQFKDLLAKDVKKRKVVLKPEEDGEKIEDTRPVSSFAVRRCKRTGKGEGKFCL
jgi:hypothetical protein